MTLDLEASHCRTSKTSWVPGSGTLPVDSGPLTLISHVFEAERESHTERWDSCPRPAVMAVRNLLFCLVQHRVFSDRGSGHILPLQCHSLGGLPPYCQFIFKTLTGSTRLDRLGFNARAPRNPILSCQESIPLAVVQIGVCWLSCLEQGVTSMGLDWPAATGKA